MIAEQVRSDSEGDLWPKTVSEIASWASRHRRMEQDATRRFCAFAALASIASDPVARQEVLIRGSGSLWLAYGNVRAPADLDLVCLHPSDAPFPESVAGCQARIDAALASCLPNLFPGLAQRQVRREPFQIQITAPCARASTIRCTISRSTPERILLVGELNYVLAEKLYWLAKPAGRRKFRSHDPFDVAMMVRLHPDRIDPGRIAHFLRMTLEAETCRPTAVSPDAFGPALKQYTATNYGQLRAWVGDHFLPFEEAWQSTVDLVARVFGHLTETG